MLDIFCQHWRIYPANNWEIYVNYGVFVRPSGAGLQIVHLLECVSFFKAYSATLHPPIDIYPPLLVEYRNTNKEIQHIFPNYWQNISNTNISIQLTYIPQCTMGKLQWEFGHRIISFLRKKFIWNIWTRIK